MGGVLAEEGSDLELAMKELETWKAKAEKADDVKARLILEKLEEEDAKKNAQQEMATCVERNKECQKELTQKVDAVDDELRKLGKRRQDLLDKLKQIQAELNAKRGESAKLKQKFKIFVEIPDVGVKFGGQKEDETEDNGQSIRGLFAISQRPSLLLQGGQALVTFEEGSVASQILKIPKCSVSCDDVNLDVKPKRITMDPSVKFEVHLNVSRKVLNVCGVPSSMGGDPEDKRMRDLQEERMKDRLVMSFSRPSRGGGEVEDMEFDYNTGTGQITFIHPGVADSLALTGKYPVDLDTKVQVQVGPVHEYQLRKFQTFRGSPKRTILLDDIADMEDEEDVQDHLEIHFQKPSNYGGEIEHVKYISSGNSLQAFFHCEDMDITEV